MMAFLDEKGRLKVHLQTCRILDKKKTIYTKGKV